MNNSELIKIARKRVKFKEHVILFFFMNLIFWITNIILNINSNSHFYWASLITIFWGIGLAFHLTKTYLYNEEEEVEKEYKKLKKTNEN